MSLPVTLFACILSRVAPGPPGAVLPATFGVGDTLLIVVVALIVFGPKKLPEISRQLGKLVFEFRKASNDFKFQIEEELRSAEQAERQKQLEAQAAAPQPATPVAMTAVETVSAESTAPHATLTENTILPPTIQPPATGLPVATDRPYGASSAAAESPEELQADSQEAVREAEFSSDQQSPHSPEADSKADHSAAEAIDTHPVPTHHG